MIDSIQARETERQKIERQTQEYLESGKKITILPPCVSRDEVETFVINGSKK